MPPKQNEWLTDVMVVDITMAVCCKQMGDEPAETGGLDVPMCPLVILKAKGTVARLAGYSYRYSGSVVFVEVLVYRQVF
jgi:hypothetical protein